MDVPQPGCAAAQWKELLLAIILLSHMAISICLSTILTSAGNTKLSAKAGHMIRVSSGASTYETPGQD